LPQRVAKHQFDVSDCCFCLALFLQELLVLQKIPAQRPLVPRYPAAPFARVRVERREPMPCSSRLPSIVPRSGRSVRRFRHQSAISPSFSRS
jgi:hypothetical protein